MMLELKDFIGSGTERDVYHHPDKPGRVIKIKRADAHVDRNVVEHAFHQATGKSDFVGIPKLFGWAETTLGRGLEYELIDDDAGRAVSQRSPGRQRWHPDSRGSDGPACAILR